MNFSKSFYDFYSKESKKAWYTILKGEYQIWESVILKSPKDLACTSNGHMATYVFITT